MKKLQRWLIAICVILIVTITILGVWQWNNIQALVEGLQYSEDEIELHINKTKQDTTAALKEYNLDGIRDLTLDEEQDLMKGKLSVEEATERILNNDVGSTTQNNNRFDSNDSVSEEGKTEEVKIQNNEIDINPTQVPAVVKTEINPNVNQIVEKYVGEMYILQATYLSELGNLEARARAVYEALPEEERNLKSAQKLAAPFINEGLSLESRCDTEVASVLAAMEAELNQVSADTDIITTMKSAYETQKRLKKSYYLSGIK